MSTALEIVSQARHIHSAVPIAPCMLYRGRDWYCGMEKVWLVRLAKKLALFTYYKVSWSLLEVFKRKKGPCYTVNKLSRCAGASL